MRIDKAAGALGAFLRDVSLVDAIADAGLHAEIRAALLEHQVLFVREQSLAAAELGAFARGFGEVERHPAYATVDGAEDVQILESTAEVPSKIEVWHTDMTFRPTPPAITVLQGQIIPAFGGDTLWASTGAAYDSLSPAMQKLVEGLEAVHDFRHGFRESLAEPGGAERLASAIADNPPVSHPVVTAHPETGRRGLYVNALFTTHVAGLKPAESRALLEFLYRHIVTDEHTVRLSWAPGTVAIWDNRATQHKPVNDFFPQHRLMHRVTIAGERPLAACRQAVHG